MGKRPRCKANGWSNGFRAHDTPINKKWDKEHSLRQESGVEMHDFRRGDPLRQDTTQSRNTKSSEHSRKPSRDWETT